MKKMKKCKMKNLKSNKGLTLIDVTISAIFIAIFTGTVASLIIKTYNMAVDIQATSTANAYATIIMEKVDEKPFDDIDNNFVEKLVNDDELLYDASSYEIKFQVEKNKISKYDYNELGLDQIFKKVTVTVTYNTSNNNKREVVFKKLKVKEIK